MITIVVELLEHFYWFFFKVEISWSLCFLDAVFADAAVFGDTNLELPSFRSNQSVVEIHVSIASIVLSKYEDQWEANLEVPLHARYQVSDLDSCICNTHP